MLGMLQKEWVHNYEEFSVAGKVTELPQLLWYLGMWKLLKNARYNNVLFYMRKLLNFSVTVCINVFLYANHISICYMFRLTGININQNRQYSQKKKL